MSTHKPKSDEVLEGVRVRVFATRPDFDVVFNDDDLDDPSALVLCYPKFYGGSCWPRASGALGESV